MKVLRNGVEVKNASIEYGANNQPEFVTADGVRQLASAFTFEDVKPKVKTKAKPKKK